MDSQLEEIALVKYLSDNVKEFKENIRYLVLWTTSSCNLNCKYCYASNNREHGNMNISTAIKGINLPTSNKFSLILAGGEPTLNFELIERVHHEIKKSGKNIRINMQSNGTLIDEYMARRIREMNIGIGISFDGPIKVNEYMRGKSKLAVQGIDNLAEAGVKINLNTVLSSYNAEYVHKLADLALYFGNVEGIGLDLLRVAGNAEESVDINTPNKNQIYKALTSLYERTKEIYKISGKKIIIREINDARRRIDFHKNNSLKENNTNDNCGQTCKYCYAAKGQAVVILPDGTMYPCGSLAGENQYYMGNIHEESTYKIKSIDYERPQKCSTCEYSTICRGACPSRFILNSRYKDIDDIDCVLRKVAFKIVTEENN